MEEVTLQFVVSPAEARSHYEVRYAGQLVPARVLTVPRSEAQLQVEISAPGYRTESIPLVPLASMAYPVTLTPLEEPKPGPVPEPKGSGSVKRRRHDPKPPTAGGRDERRTTTISKDSL